jgi:predicted phosphodiesterase
MSSASAPHTILVLLSDLHFGQNLTGETSIPPLPTSKVFRLLQIGPAAERYVLKKCTAHDSNIIRRLPRYLTELLIENRGRGYYRDSFDYYILAGDLATWADVPTYKFLKHYLTRQSYTMSDDMATYKCQCLGLHPSQIIAIPGNHDKLFRSDLDLYHQNFTTPDLPSGPLPERCHLVSRRSERQKLLFILVDASVYGSTTLGFGVGDHLARGEVTRDLLDEVRQKLDRLKAGSAVDDAGPDSYAKAVRILVVHYAIDAYRVGGVPMLFNLLRHDCEGIEDLLKVVKDDIHFAVHGHLHAPAVYNSHGVPVVAAGTASQRVGSPGARPNDFFLIKLFDNEAMAVERHVWSHTDFVRDPDPQFTRVLR